MPITQENSTARLDGTSQNLYPTVSVAKHILRSVTIPSFCTVFESSGYAIQEAQEQV